MSPSPSKDAEQGPFQVDISELLASASGRREVRIEGICPDLRTPTVDAGTTMTVAGVLERIAEGIVARGNITGSWNAACSSGLEPIVQPYEFSFGELFEMEPLEGETYPIQGAQIDLEQLIRDTVLPELPLAPRCAEAVDGFCDRCRDNRTDPPEASIDPRWAALSALEVPDAIEDAADFDAN